MSSSWSVGAKTPDARLSLLSPKPGSPGACDRPVEVFTIHEQGLDGGKKKGSCVNLYDRMRHLHPADACGSIGGGAVLQRGLF